jgi:hypothetical protein
MTAATFVSLVSNFPNLNRRPHISFYTWRIRLADISMDINEYSFGKIIVDGQTYTSDVIITPERVIDSWRRKEGHRLDKGDLDKIIDANPDCVLVGTGYYGRMTVPQETIHYLQAKNIRIEYAPTADAIAKLGQLQKDYARLVAALHLTC